MENPEANSFAVSSVELARITRWFAWAFFMLLFAFTGVDKWLHFAQFLNAVKGYVLVPSNYAQTIALFVASFEMWLGLGFAVPVLRRMAAGMASGMLIIFAGALWANYHFGVLAPCGCWFSVTLSQATPPHIFFDVFLAGVAGTLWLDTSH